MKQKINIRLAIIAVLAVVATTVGTTTIYYNLFKRQVRNDLRIEAELIRSMGLLQQIYESSDPEDLNGELQSLNDLTEENLRITWVDADGTVLYDNDKDATLLENHKDRTEIQEAFKTGVGEEVRRSDTLDMDTYYYALKLEDGTVIRVATEARTILSIFLSSMPFIIWLVSAIILLCIWISYVLTKQLLIPIEKMAENLDDSSQEPAYKELVPFADKIRLQHENILSIAKSRQDFTASVSHELKTPLTAISGYAELIENHMAQPNQEIYFASQIRKNADRLLALINDIIQLSELDHQEVIHEFAHVDLYEIAKECVQSLNVNAQRRNVEIIFSGMNCLVYGEQHMIREMIVNLIQNAIQYNNEGGKVLVYAGNRNGRGYLRVEDNGIGISKEMQEHVFERFYRVDKSRSRETGGTGLGLAIVKHIVEIHGASIKLDSAPGRGTRISVSF
ncbi:MAG TPA: two-component sensor histidine kinase [Candidatus Fimousia stercorigallinarum]|nr:two-component sensor histidine kinase [Candidatus Fimousia stercorigallinarum]